MNLKADRRALKRAARDNIAGAWPRPWKVTLLFILLTTGVTLLVTTLMGDPWTDLANAAAAALEAGYDYADVVAMVGSVSQRQSVQGLLTAFVQILLGLYSVVAAFGFAAYNLRRTKGAENGGRDLLCGFGMVGRVLWMQVIIFVFSLGWSLMVVFPAMGVLFVAALPLSYLAAGEGSYLLVGLLAYGVMIAAFIVVYFLTLRYDMAVYLLADHPEWRAMDAVRRSREMLRGRLWELFRIKLSFLGWGLLHLVVLFGAVMLAAGGFGMAGLNPEVARWLVAAVNLAAVLPVGLWLLPYFHGTAAEYYVFLTSRAHPGPQLRVDADDGETF